MIELKVGQMAVIAGIKVKCVENEPQDEFDCTQCVGDRVDEVCKELECSRLSRSDDTYVHFVESFLKERCITLILD